MKKLILNIASLIAAAVVLTVAVFAAPLPFADVPEDAWYYNDVRTAYRSGLINGKSATSFAPDANLTYAESVKLAACLHQFFEEGKVTLENGDPWYQSYVDYCEENGIIDREYDWNENATRGGYMEIFVRALSDEVLYPMNAIQDGAIPDVPADHPQADGIYKLYRAGILQGSDAETHACNPESSIRRSEVSAIIARILDSDKRIEFEMIIDIPFEIVTQPADFYADAESCEALLAVEAAGNDVTYDWQAYDFTASTWVSLGVETAELSIVCDFAETDAIHVFRCVLRDGDEELITDTAAVYPPVTVVEITKMPADKQRTVSVILSYTEFTLAEARALTAPAEAIVSGSTVGLEMVEKLAELGGEAAVVVKSAEGLKFVRLIDVGASRIEVIKLIDAHTGCGLTAAQKLVKQSSPIIGRFMTADAAASFAKALESAGATVEIE